MLHVPADLTALARTCGWGFFNEIAWLKGEISGTKTTFGSYGYCSAPFLSRNHEHILLFYKGTIRLDGDKSLCDLSPQEHLAWRTTAWDIKPEVSRDLRCQHPAPFPEAIPHRLIKMFTYGGDVVIDPYNGSGTTSAVAKRLGRRYIGIDRSPSYCDLARQRLVTAVTASDAA